MKTAHILMAQYEGLAVIPLDLVCRHSVPSRGEDGGYQAFVLGLFTRHGAPRV